MTALEVMNLIMDSLILSNKLLGVPFFYLIDFYIYPQYQRIIQNSHKGRIYHLRNDDVHHVITDIKLGPEKKHQHVADESEYKVGNCDDNNGNSHILREKDGVELTYNKAKVHIDHGKKAYVRTKKDVHQKSAEKADHKSRLITSYKCSGSCKDDQKIRHYSAKVHYSKDRSLQNKRKKYKYEVKYKSSNIHSNQFRFFF